MRSETSTVRRSGAHLYLGLICRMEINGALGSKFGVETGTPIENPRSRSCRIGMARSQHSTPEIEAPGGDIFASLSSIDKNINTLVHDL